MPYYEQQPSERRPMIPVVTRNILIVNAIFFIATLINENFMVSTFGLFYPASQYFRWWQPLTHMFMHGGWWHIFFNMYSLVMFGMVVERALGTKKYLYFYFITGLGAVAFHTFVEWLEIKYMGGSLNAAMYTPMGQMGLWPKSPAGSGSRPVSNRTVTAWLPGTQETALLSPCGRCEGSTKTFLTASR